MRFFGKRCKIEFFSKSGGDFHFAFLKEFFKKRESFDKNI
jgi:hypothetical protein